MLQTGIILFPLWCLLLISNALANEVVKVNALTCERLKNPIGIDEIRPRLSWQIESGKRNVFQLEYEVMVASSSTLLEQDKADLWASGKIRSGTSVDVEYKGAPLRSGMDCFWKVRVVTNTGTSAWSAPAHWKMGLLYYKDWQGRWIGFDRAFPWDETVKNSQLSARYFRKEFKASKKIVSATASIIGLGLYELSINGRKVGDQVLSPAPTDYRKNVLYNTFDVTDQLKTGANTIGVVLGNGRFFAMRQHTKPYKNNSFGFPKLLFQLNIRYDDGSSAKIVSDETWKGTANGPITANNEYDGEVYDARKEMTGWDQPGFDDKLWLQAELVQEPGGAYQAQMNQPVKVMKELVPHAVSKQPNGAYIVDIGQNIAGWIQLKVKGSRGTQVKMRFAESLKEDGGIFTENLRDAKATDVYTLKGGTMETWEPKFVYHGFRYVEITGYPGVFTTDMIRGKMVYDAMDNTGTFSSSDNLLNRIFTNAWWGIAGNYKGMPIDCPQRNERQPWLGDRPISSYGEHFLFDNGRLYAKWLEDIALAQKEDGAIPDVAPAFWRYYSDNMSWPGALLLVAEMLYTQDGDARPIQQHYPVMKKWLGYMKDRYMTDDFLVTKDSYGDWCVPPVTIEAGRGKSADKKYPSPLIATSYYYHFTQLMTSFAKISGNEADTLYYQELGEKIKASFHKNYFRNQGFYGDSSLTHNLLPLYFGMVPDDRKDLVLKNVIRTIEVVNKGHLSTGLVGVQWLMRTLTENGRPDLAYTIATQRSYPGWGYMIENGATTIWELWNGNTAHPKMNSQNHVMMLGDLLIWYFEHLAGIRSGNGFQQISMKPEKVDQLKNVTASYQSVYGKIRSEWRRNNGVFQWKITVPANTSAEVFLFATSPQKVRESGKPVNASEDIKFIRMEDGYAVFKIGSGDYYFESEM